MVQLLMRIPDGTELGEWTIVELQGDLETKSQAASLNGKFVGDLHYSHKGEPVLIIGHHILYGKATTLERPFIAVKKVHRDLQGQQVEAMETEASEAASTKTQSCDTEYSVKAVIRKKLIFKTRPKPIIANVPKKIS